MMHHHAAAFRAAPADLQPVIATLALRMAMNLPPAPIAIAYNSTHPASRCARITRIGGDLLVEHNGHEYRRIAGRWLMRGNSGALFEREMHDSTVRNQVADYDCCLRTYRFEEGPDYPTGRRKGESVLDFIGRLQIAELRHGGKNIFAPVNTKYTPCEDHRREYAARMRARGEAIDRRDPWIKYKEAMAETRKARAAAKRKATRELKEAA